MIESDDGSWLTYQQASAMLGLKPEGVRSLARRKGWARQTPNEIGGVARVRVPTGPHQRERPDRTDGATEAANGVDRGQRGGALVDDSLDDAAENAPVDRGAPAVLAVEVAMLRERLDDKDAVIADLHQRLDGADRRLDAALAAQQKATDEAAGLCAELDARQTWGLRRRLRWALGRKR
jgi:hypothetical protein